MTGGSSLSRSEAHIERRALRAALIDSTTMEAMIASTDRSHAMLLVALEGLARFAGTAGQAACDSVVVEFGDRLCRYAPPSSHVARLDGYVFAVLLESSDSADAVADARMLSRHVAAPYRVDGRHVHFSLSRGMSVSQPWGDGNTRLLERARMALWRALELGTGDLVSFHVGMDIDAPYVLSLADDCGDPLHAPALSLAYRPVLDLASGEISSLDAAPQWKHARKGTIPSDVIASLGDRFRLPRSLNDWILDELCGQVGRWRHQRGLRWSTSIRLSAGQACDVRFVDLWLARIAGAGIEPSDISLAVHETTVVAYRKAVFSILRELTAAGVSCALDGFSGEGLTLARLQALPVDEVRIDRSLIRSITQDRHDMTLVDGIVSFADALGLRVVADGVESRDQQAMLFELGCTAIQGSFVGREMAGRDVLDFVGATRRFPPFPIRNSGPVALESPMY